ncbi:MAG: BTAD domain-containing putative transcriptional regulator, partial [Gemmatimonadota bacterium]
MATGAHRRLSRDKLIAYLWPESPPDVARHRLSVRLHDLRKALGKDVLLSDGDDVSLHTGVIRVDVAEFERHAGRKEWSRAIEVYAGQFLDGFYLSDAAEFERWVEIERERLARMYSDALTRAADQCAAIGDTSEQINVLRKLAAHEPFSARATIALMRALDATGDRSAALEYARAHEERLREEFNAEPDAEVVACARQLQDNGHRATGTGIRFGHVPERVHGDRPIAHPPDHPTAVRSAALGIVLVVLVLGSWTIWSNRASSTSAASIRLAVMPFRLHGDSRADYLRDGIPDLLSKSLDGAGDIHITADASDANATGYLSGSIHSWGPTLRIHAEIRAAPQQKLLAQATVEGGQNDVLHLIDRLGAQLIVAISPDARTRTARIAELTTASLPALKAYLAGERDFRAGRFATAIDSFARAVQLDTTFALANYRLALAMLWADVPDTLPFEPEQRALRFSRNLSLRDQRLIRAFIAWRTGNAQDAEVLYRQVVTMYPDDVEAWQQLGETLFHYNPLRG